MSFGKYEVEYYLDGGHPEIYNIFPAVTVEQYYEIEKKMREF
jgi:hypothetical protein